MTSSTTDLRFESLTADIPALLEKHGYRLPPGGDHVRALVMARVDTALKDLVEIFEGRIW